MLAGTAKRAARLAALQAALPAAPKAGESQRPGRHPNEAWSSTRAWSLSKAGTCSGWKDRDPDAGADPDPVAKGGRKRLFKLIIE